MKIINLKGLNLSNYTRFNAAIGKKVIKKENLKLIVDLSKLRSKSAIVTYNETSANRYIKLITGVEDITFVGIKTSSAVDGVLAVTDVANIVVRTDTTNIPTLYIRDIKAKPRTITFPDLQTCKTVTCKTRSVSQIILPNLIGAEKVDIFTEQPPLLPKLASAKASIKIISWGTDADILHLPQLKLVSNKDLLMNLYNAVVLPACEDVAKSKEVSHIIARQVLVKGLKRVTPALRMGLRNGILEEGNIIVSDTNTRILSNSSIRKNTNLHLINTPGGLIVITNYHTLINCTRRSTGISGETVLGEKLHIVVTKQNGVLVEKECIKQENVVKREQKVQREAEGYKALPLMREGMRRHLSMPECCYIYERVTGKSIEELPIKTTLDPDFTTMLTLPDLLLRISYISREDYLTFIKLVMEGFEYEDLAKLGLRQPLNHNQDNE